MIIKKCLKNFLNSMKYYLPSLAILLICILIGVSSFIKKSGNDINNLITLLDSELTNAENFNVSAFKNSIMASFKNLPWNNFWQTITTLFSHDFLVNSIKNALLSVLNVSELSTEMTSSIETAANSITLSVISFTLWFVLGILICYFYTRIMVKKDLKMNMTLKRIIFVIIINYIINISFVALITYLIGLLPIGAILTVILTLFINQGISLFEAYLSREQKSINFKKIFTFKNISYLVLGTLIISFILILVSGIIVGITNQTIGLILSIPLYFLLLSVISFNAYSYVKDYYKDLRN